MLIYFIFTKIQKLWESYVYLDMSTFADMEEPSASPRTMAPRPSPALPPSPRSSPPGAVARSEACPLGMQAAPSSIPTSSTFFHGDLVMKTFLRPFSLYR